MKPIFTCLLVLLTSITAFAQNSGRLSISTPATGSIIAIIDNRSYQINNSREFFINEISSGTHFIKIIRQGRSGNWRRNTIVYENNFFIRRGMHVDITINRFGKVFIDEEAIHAMHNDQTYNDNCDQTNYENWNQNNPYNTLPQAISQTSFNQLKQIVNNERFDNTRISIAKQAISANMFTAQQAKELINLFTYENSKLDIAKNMYPKTVDKSNYMIVYDVFTYSSSKEELARFFQQYG